MKHLLVLAAATVLAGCSIPTRNYALTTSSDFTTNSGFTSTSVSNSSFTRSTFPGHDGAGATAIASTPASPSRIYAQAITSAIVMADPSKSNGGRWLIIPNQAGVNRARKFGATATTADYLAYEASLLKEKNGDHLMVGSFFLIAANTPEATVIVQRVKTRLYNQKDWFAGTRWDQFMVYSSILPYTWQNIVHKYF